MVADHVGREQVVTAIGQEWRVGRWTRAVWADFTTWARGKLPDPLESAAKHVEHLPREAGEMLLRVALDKASSYLAFNSPEMMSLLNSVEGMVHLLWLLLRDRQPEITEDEAYDIFVDLGQDELGRIFTLARGKAPAGNGEAPAA